MKVLIVGSGGREHALAWKLRQSHRLDKLWALPGSSGISHLAECLPGNPLDAAAVARRSSELGADLVVIGPEAPLAAGLADALRARGLRCFGPSQAATRLESSKAFAKDFLRRHGIPTAACEVFDEPSKALDAAAGARLPVVVKADGLTGGKGVRVCASRREALEAVQDFMVKLALGDSGRRVVLEEFLEGQELTVLALCDGRVMRPLPYSRDHKRLWDGDGGPNTGGMGAFAPVVVPVETHQRIREDILDKVLRGLAAEGIDYRGVLYVGLMLTDEGPKVLEFNARFGDPETQAVLPLLQTDLLDLLEAAADSDLGRLQPAFHPGHAVTVVLASEGYPASPVVGRRIEGLEAVDAAFPGVTVFHAGTRRVPEGWLTAGGRVLDVTATGATLEEARTRAYRAAEQIRFEGRHYRTDIGTEGKRMTEFIPLKARLPAGVTPPARDMEAG